MSLASRAGDLLYTFRFIKLLTTPFNESDAFKMGLIDADGKRIKEAPLDSSDKKAAYSPFVRLSFNIKRLIGQLPGGKTTLGSYAAALYLIKEKYHLSDKNLKKICEECGIDVLDLLAEDTSWYLLENNLLTPGIYRVKSDKVLASTLEEMVRAKDQIRILDNSYPIGEVFGLNVYEAIHLNTNQPIRITLGEIYK